MSILIYRICEIIFLVGVPLKSNLFGSLKSRRKMVEIFCMNPVVSSKPLNLNYFAISSVIEIILVNELRDVCEHVMFFVGEVKLLHCLL